MCCSGGAFPFQKVNILVFQNLSAYDITPVLFFMLSLRGAEQPKRVTFSLEFNICVAHGSSDEDGV